MRRQYGLDQPIYVQYIAWVGKLAVRRSRPLDHQSGSRRGTCSRRASSRPCRSASPHGCSRSLIAVPVGIVSAVQQRTWRDWLGTIGSLVGAAMPYFLTGGLLIYVVAMRWRLLPASGYVSPFVDPLDSVKTTILPALTLALWLASTLTRQTRASFIDVLAARLHQDGPRQGPGRGPRGAGARLQERHAAGGDDPRHPARRAVQRRRHHRDDLRRPRRRAGCWSIPSSAATIRSSRRSCCSSPLAVVVANLLVDVCLRRCSIRASRGAETPGFEEVRRKARSSSATTTPGAARRRRRSGRLWRDTAGDDRPVDRGRGDFLRRSLRRARALRPERDGLPRDAEQARARRTRSAPTTSAAIFLAG